MRALLIALTAAATVFGLPAAASAQYAIPPTISGKASISPNKAGTKKKPAAVAVNATITSNAEQSRVSANQIVLLLPKSLRFDGAGLKAAQYCSAAKINAHGVSACAAASEIGAANTPTVRNGTDALLYPRATPLSFPTRVFLASRTEMAIFLASPAGLSLNKAIRGVVGTAGGRFGQKVTITIPPELVSPIPGAYSGIKTIKIAIKKMRIGKGAARHPVFGLDGCPANRKLPFGARMDFVSNPSPPAAAFAEGQITVPCRK